MSKREKILIVVIGVLTIIVLFGSGVFVGGTFQPRQQASASPTAQRSSQPSEATPSSSADTSEAQAQQSSVPVPSGLERAKVIKVVDGDTIEIEGGRTVRYIGIDTPETKHPSKGVECYGKEATEANRMMIEGKDILLEKDVSETDRYQRLLRYVYVNNVMVNEYLVKQGFAFSSSYPPDVKHQERMRVAQKEAFEKERGLWKACKVSSDQSKILGYATDASTPTAIVTSAPALSQAGTPSSASGAHATPSTQKDNSTQFTGGTTQKAGCMIKGNISSDKIYHMPGCGSYEKTSIDESAGEKWFCSESEAIAAGWRKAKNC